MLLKKMFFAKIENYESYLIFSYTEEISMGKHNNSNAMPESLQTILQGVFWQSTSGIDVLQACFGVWGFEVLR